MHELQKDQQDCAVVWRKRGADGKRDDDLRKAVRSDLQLQYVTLRVGSVGCVRRTVSRRRTRGRGESSDRSDVWVQRRVAVCFAHNPHTGSVFHCRCFTVCQTVVRVVARGGSTRLFAASARQRDGANTVARRADRKNGALLRTVHCRRDVRTERAILQLVEFVERRQERYTCRCALRIERRQVIETVGRREHRPHRRVIRGRRWPVVLAAPLGVARHFGAAKCVDSHRAARGGCAGNCASFDYALAAISRTRQV